MLTIGVFALFKFAPSLCMSVAVGSGNFILLVPSSNEDDDNSFSSISTAGAILVLSWVSLCTFVLQWWLMNVWINWLN